VADDVYTFADQTYENLAKAEITPLAVMDALGGAPTVRRHIGSSLQIAGQDRTGDWLVVALVEGAADDEYTVTGARRLDDAELAIISRLIGKEET
jgi:hypothetical protein